MQTLSLTKKMVDFGDTYEDLAKALGVSVQTLCNKTVGKTEFLRSEIEIIIERYQLTPCEVMEIFFTSKCTENKHILKHAK